MNNTQSIPEGVTVQSLEIKNFLGIKELSFSPDGKFNFITGRNGAGKTSILRAIQFAFEGKERGTNELDYIYNGEDKAEILINLGQFKINRRITPSGNYVDVEKNGMKYESPANILKSMVGKFSFNPIEFAFCKPKERNEIVLKALNIEYDHTTAIQDDVIWDNGEEVAIPDDVTGFDLVEFLEKHFYAKRADVNRALDLAKKGLKESKATLPEDFKGFDKAEYDKILAAVKNGKEVLRGQELELKTYEQSKFEVEKYIRAIKEILKVYGDDEVHCKIDLIIDKVKKQKKDIEKTKEGLKKMEDKEIKMRKDMEHFAVQTRIKEYEERIPKGEELSADLTRKIEKLRGEIKQRLISEADIGIEGLSFVDGNFKVNDVLVENLSDSEKLRIGVKIAEKVSGKLEFIFIDGVERLDPETLKEFTQDLSGSAFQYFFTTCHQVTDCGKMVEISNGKIKC